MQFETIFDAAQAGYETWPFAAFGFIFVVAGSLLVFAPELMKKILPAGLQGRARKIFSRIFLGFAILWTLGSFVVTYGEYSSIQQAIASKQYETVEGVVSDFVPMPYTGHAMEKFKVNGIPFSYSDYLVTSGFNNTASHGRPIHEGVYVRIAYLGNKIIKLEVAKNLSDNSNHLQTN